MMRLRRSLVALLQRRRFERDMRAELDAHIALRADDLAASGLPHDEALRRARVEFGALEAYKEQCRDVRGFAAFRPLHGLWRDLRVGARRLASAPIFLVFAVVSLAIGLSVTTAAYSILYALFWRPIGIHEPDRVVMLTTPWSAPRWILVMSKPDFDDLRATQRSFSAVAASAAIGQSVVTATKSEIVTLEAVTGDYFSTLGLAPEVGRLLQPADADRQVAVLSHLLWRTRFHADPQVVGQVLRVGGRPYEIVGVAPRSFDGLRRPPRATALWVPLDAADVFSGDGAGRAERERRRLVVVARLASGRSLEQASSEVFAISGSLDTTAPIHNEHARTPDRRVQRQWKTMPIGRALAPPDTLIGILLLALVALVLVVACANLANLMLARGAARRQEIAVRRALGASRWRVIRELLVESAIVAVLGGALGLALTRALLVFGTVEIPIGHGSVTIDAALNLPALVATGGAVLLSLVVFGLAPAVQLTRKDVPVDRAAQTASDGTPSRRQRTLIRGQVAISTCFLLIAAILARIILAGASHDPGIALDRLALTTVHLSLLGWDEARARRALDRAADIARRQPGIASVSVSSGMPFGQLMTPNAEITTLDKPFVESRIRGLNHTAPLLASTPQIFHTLQVPIVRGRAFDDRDDAAAAKVAVITERAARALFATADAVGRRFLLRLSSTNPAAAELTVIGVTRDTDVNRYMERREGAIFVPLAQCYLPNLVFSARVSGSPVAAVGILQDALRQADPELSTGMAGTGPVLLAGEVVAARLAGALAAALAFVMLTLAMVGLYGIQMHAVASRTREVGLRMALGASVRQIQQLVLRQGYAPVVQGVVIGVVVGSIARLALKAVVVAQFQVFDPSAMAAVALALFAAAFLACWLPARRAARVDPNVALRHL